MMANKLPWQIFHILALVLVLVLNGLSNGKLIPGRSVGDISDSYPTLFTPAGVTFAIWGVIYLFLIGFSIYQGRDMFSATKVDMPFLKQIGPWFLISCAANSIWLFPWLYQRPALALIMMLVLFASLFVIYLQLEIGVMPVSRAEKWLVHAPFSMYLGWITVATIANVSITLVANEWSGFGLSPQTWATVMVSAAGVIGFGVALFRADMVFALVIIWALFGIITARDADPVPANERIIWAAYLSIGLVALGAIIGTWRAEAGIGYVK
ncbi:MAG: tryptophan-rich sensory protein [Bacteroidia bacterium]|nr:tryptophan-rich sensory protein [Bacteroidia bacterium]